MSDLSSLLDMKLDDLADMPEFKVFPPGAHRVTISWEQKKIGEHPAIELKMKLVETVELGNPTDTPCDAGTECSVAFMLDNEFGQGKFKEIAKTLAAHFGTSSVGKTLEASASAEVLVITKTRQNKEKTQTYLDVVKLEVL